MELKFADPYVSDYEKNKIREMHNFQQRNLVAAQTGLQNAQETLERVAPTSRFGPPQSHRESDRLTSEQTYVTLNYG